MFKDPSISDLPLALQVIRYRALAQDCEDLAASSKGNLRQSYLLVVENCRRLAEEVEKQDAGAKA